MGDASPEKALWGILQKEAEDYTSTGVIGSTLQQAVDDTLGLHAIESLVTKLTAWSNYQRAVLQSRATHIKNILSLQGGDEYDVTLNWP